AIHQYRHDRDPREPIFLFTKRTLVHFAVDTEEAHMTTRLAGTSTHFLPFNKGWDGSAGNPPDSHGRNYKTAYLWEEVLSRDSLLDLLARSLHLNIEEKISSEGKKVSKETMIFPRYHQLKAVRQMVAAAGSEGVGHNYLVEHSAGSGKSNTIGWLAHRLSSLHNEQDERIFDSVVVITDRVVLDRQLQNTIYQFDHRQGVVQKIDEDSRQLAEALEAGVPIIITTLQKFPFVSGQLMKLAEERGEGNSHLPTRKYAVIIDEAHSSQSGETATELKGVLGGAELIRKAREAAQEEGEAELERLFRAKAMVVTGSRLEAVRYKQEFDRYISEKGYPIKSLVAFSGTVEDDKVPEKSYTEVEMNHGLKEKELPETFARPDYRVLLVAEKYQTGFDQPLLHTMYVDKRLAGIQAVQTLSRLNRTHPLKDDTFVLDFVNDPDEIQEAFRQYYDGSVMGEEVDPDRLYEVKAELDGSGIYLQDEVDAFSRIFFAPKRRQSPADHKNMNALLDQAVARFAQLQNDEEEEAELWRGKTQAFRNLYSFLSQVIPYQDSDLEKLFTYLRHLALKLPKRKSGPGYQFDEEVELDYYRLQKISEGSINLDEGYAKPLDGPREVGSGMVREPGIVRTQGALQDDLKDDLQDDLRGDLRGGLQDGLQA
ncbi:MAG: type I restriction endonuclease subunit R, partial [Chloroflexia bacterium]|nr:type I restriction endonuclease subunit R [Chloroflexia bacterium]